MVVIGTDKGSVVQFCPMQPVSAEQVAFISRPFTLEKTCICHVGSSRSIYILMQETVKDHHTVLASTLLSVYPSRICRKISLYRISQYSSERMPYIWELSRPLFSSRSESVFPDFFQSGYHFEICRTLFWTKKAKVLNTTETAGAHYVSCVLYLPHFPVRPQHLS